MSSSPNPYEPTKHAHRVAVQPLFGTYLVGLLIIGIAAVLLLSISISQQRFRILFNDFDVDLPVLSQVCLNPALPWLLAVVFSMAAMKETLTPSPRFFTVWNTTLISALVVGIVAYVGALALPLFSLIRALE